MSSARQARDDEAAALLSDTVRAMRRSGIREMMDLADAADGVLHLEIGEPDFPTDASARAPRSGGGHAGRAGEVHALAWHGATA